MKAIYIITLLLLAWPSVFLAQKGSVEGRVYNAANNEPLPFTNVLVQGTKTGATTDFEGRYIITNLDPGFIQLEITSLGFESRVSEEIQILSGKTITLDVALNESNIELNTVNVTAKRFTKNTDAPLSMRSISISEIENSAGVNRDISKVVQTFPGVAALPGANRNDIIVRGGASSESKFYLDDVEIPNINHFATQGASGGTNGILNADFIREVNFYASAFPSGKGNALSGVFDFRQIDGNSERFKYRGALGASEISLTADGPLSEKTTIIASARRSYLQFLFKALGLPFLPTFNDYQVKVRTRIDEKNEITIISVGALDQFRLDTDIENPDEFQKYILNYLPVYEQWNYTIGGVYKHYRQNGYTTLVLSRNMLHNRSYKYFENKELANNLLLDYTSREMENKMRLENNIRLGDGTKIVFGLNSELDKYENSTFQKVFANSVTDTIEYSSSLEMMKFGFFGQVTRLFFNDLLSVSAGIRADGNSYQSSMYNPLSQLSPRISLSYSLSEKVSINTSAGRYFQLPPYTTLGYRDMNGTLLNQNESLKYIQSDHLVAGLEFRVNSGSRFTIEGFYKKYLNYPVGMSDSLSLAFRPVDFGVVGDEQVSSTGEGRVAGFEMLYQGKIAGSTNLVVSYTYAVSEFLGKNGEWIPASWDNRHIFIASASRKLGKKWNVAAKWRFAGGLPYTPYDLERSSDIQAWNITGRPYSDVSRVNGERFAAFHQLDIRIDRSFYFKNSGLKVYLDIQNLYNFKSEEQPRITNLDVNGNQLIDPLDPTRYQLRVIPSEGSGTVLPTIGVIVDF